MSSKIRICSRCSKIGLENIEYSMYWSVERGKYRYQSQCKECLNKYARKHNKKYYRDNSDKILKHKKEYHKKNRRKILEKKKEHYYNNKEHVLSLKKAWKDKNKDKVKEMSIRDYKKHKARINAQRVKRRALKINQTPNLTENEKKKIEVYYMISQYLGEEWHVDHITPLSKKGLHHPDNLQITTKKYNLEKSDKTDFREPDILEYFRI